MTAPSHQQPPIKTMIEKLKPVLPAGHKWRRNHFVLEASPGTHRSVVFSGYQSLPMARKDAQAIINAGSAREVSVIRYSQSSVSIRDHVVEIVTAPVNQ